MKKFIKKLGILALEIPVALTIVGAMMYNNANPWLLGIGALVFGGSIGYTLRDNDVFKRDIKPKQ
jgi:1,4-dihydroxy-2-naphthoate octaprenyltransferase